VKAACLRTLSDLGLEYLDLYLIHFPNAQKFIPFEERYPAGWNFTDKPGMQEDNVAYSETWSALEDLVREGLVRNIGVCNIGTSLLRDVLNYAKIKPAVLQVELHPYLTQEILVRFCRTKGIAVTGFSNLGAGSYVVLGMSTIEESCLSQQVVKDIAQKHGRTPA
jgi:diketogulonate reductase-like aldo/keto reductase